MSECRTILSAGLDVGTTTTQIVLARLTMRDEAGYGRIPRISVTDCEVIHRSPVVFTPLVDRDTLDTARLLEFAGREYAAAGVRREQVESGAVIVTGEMAKKRNADELLRELSGLAGEFVVGIAGPHLESLIAGRGSGAAACSRENYATVTNVDIGGGSANGGVFRSGSLVASSAMNYGGRIMEIERSTGRIRHIAEPAARVLNDCGLNMKVGDRPPLSDLRRFTDRLADLTVELVEGGSSALASALYLTPPSPVSGKDTLLMFSGGVGYYYYHFLPIHTVEDAAMHDDLGPLLAESLRQHPLLGAWEVREPRETLRATVLGAGTRTVTLSGSTIWAERNILPLRNVPVVRPVLPDIRNFEKTEIVKIIRDALLRSDIDPASAPFAIAVETGGPLDYADLSHLARELAEFASVMPAGKPLIVLVDRDYARCLGQTLKGLAPERPLLAIDQAHFDEGDYIDIGTPLMDGRVVPMSIKTLIFYH
ncbi:MAG: ethanolamine ammonia-lyase reactivating factor EutA [Desulfobacteraceae bacterium]|nr:ethanolamine ammonia-lyase reactivating factor EutA [Desulfobacteraceae bacterium]